jgi:hypothetical protein
MGTQLKQGLEPHKKRKQFIEALKDYFRCFILDKVFYLWKYLKITDCEFI